jgi:allantoinase
VRAAFDLVVRAQRAITPDGENSVCLGVRDGKIAAVEPQAAQLSAPIAIDLPMDEVLLPGLVDSHVHVNDPGRTEWETFATATRAAAAGGVTTIVDMPLNSIPPTVGAAALEIKRKAAQEQAFVDVAFWGGAVPGNVADLRPLHDAGVSGFKCFTLHSGVDEFPALDDAGIEWAMREIAAFDGLLIVHAEDAACIDRSPAANGRSYADFLASRPQAAETVAVKRIVELADLTRVPGAHPACLRRGCRAAGGRGARARSPHHRRNVPALPHLRGRGDSRRCDRVQVLPADPRSHEPRTALAGPERRRDRPHRQ